MEQIPHAASNTTNGRASRGVIIPMQIAHESSSQVLINQINDSQWEKKRRHNESGSLSSKVMQQGNIVANTAMLIHSNPTFQQHFLLVSPGPQAHQEPRSSWAGTAEAWETWEQFRF